MFRNLVTGIAFAGAAAFAQTSTAATVNITTINNPVLFTAEVFDFTTTGADMGGMIVTATFASGATQSAVWGATGAVSGGAFGSMFEVFVDGDTYTSVWSLKNTSAERLVSVFFNGPAGNTIFDRTEPSNGPNFGTENSRRGRDFTYVSGAPNGVIDVTYSGIIALESDVPVGDIYAFLNVDLNGLAGGGLASGTTLRFRQDTDNAIVPVPVPASFLLFASALGGVGFLARRRKAIA